MTTETSSTAFRFIPVRQLSLSPLNVRKTAGEAGIEELAELIHAEGILQNLDVYASQEGESEKGATHEVVAGGRRWRALQRLIEQGRITPDYPVPCLIVSYERAVQISLAENSGREPMLGLLLNLSSVPGAQWRRRGASCFWFASILKSSQQCSLSARSAVRSSGCESADRT